MSRAREVEVIVEQGNDSGNFLVKSPGVGIWSRAPRVGGVLVAGSRVGRLTSLGRTIELVLPRGVSGRIAERMLRHRQDPVDYGQVLLRLTSVDASEAVAAAESAPKSSTDDLPEGSFAVSSPTHGMFYRRPRPDAAAYVEISDVIEEGNTLALVEVMKCFSAITYGGEGLPPRAKVIEIRAEDASEVQAEQVLFVVQST